MNDDTDLEDVSVNGHTTPLTADPNHQRVPPRRAFSHALSILDDALSDDSGSVASSAGSSVDSQGRPCKSRAAERAAHFVKKYERRHSAKGIREDALAVLSMAEKREGRHVPRALSGLNLGKPIPYTKKGKKPRQKVENDDVSQHSASSSSTEDIIDVVRLQNRAACARALLESDDVLEDEELLADNKRSSASWSSRYSMDKTLLALTGAGGPEALGQQRDRKIENGNGSRSARDMFASSAHTVKNLLGKSDNSSSQRRVFGEGFTFRRASASQGLLPNSDHDNWKTYDAEGRDINDDYDRNERGAAHSLPMASESNKTWEERARAQQYRRRMCIWLLICIALVVACGSLVGMLVRHSKNRNSDMVANESIGNNNGGESPAPEIGSGDDGATLSDGAIVSDGTPEGQVVSFFVTSGPVDSAGAENQLQKGLQSLPDDAEFVIHLGNLQDRRNDTCPAETYTEAASVLQLSKVPLFVLPGEDDWLRCPSPEKSWRFWKQAFVNMEDYYSVRDFDLHRHHERPENFAILHKGVLFLGLHIVESHAFEDEEWDALVLETDNFVFGMLEWYDEKFRSVVVLGNARPGVDQIAFFTKLRTRLDGVGVPLAYVHASGEASSGEQERYDLFGSDDGKPSRIGLQIQDISRVPESDLLQKITVGFGNDPFVLG